MCREKISNERTLLNFGNSMVSACKFPPEATTQTPVDLLLAWSLRAACSRDWRLPKEAWSGTQAGGAQEVSQIWKVHHHMSCCSFPPFVLLGVALTEGYLALGPEGFHYSNSNRTRNGLLGLDIRVWSSKLAHILEEFGTPRIGFWMKAWIVEEKKIMESYQILFIYLLAFIGT